MPNHSRETSQVEENSGRNGLFPVRRNGRLEWLSYEQLFAAGHRLWLKGQYSTAATVFEELAAAKDHGPRAAIFLAHCHAMLGDFGRCSASLNRALPRETFRDAAARLHDLFVFWKVGLLVEVRTDLIRLSEDFPELPSISLLLGDLLFMNGAVNRSRRFLQQAIHCDEPNGAVAEAARWTLGAAENN